MYEETGEKSNYEKLDCYVNTCPIRTMKKDIMHTSIMELEKQNLDFIALHHLSSDVVVGCTFSKCYSGFSNFDKH